jgi:hypothetical protein
MRAIAGGIEPDFLEPVVDDSGVLSCAKVSRLANTAWEKEVLRLQSSPFDPRLKRLARRRRDFKLHRMLHLLLQYHGSSRNANALNRNSLGTKNKGLKYNADGSLTLYASAKSPGKDKESNWLPAPGGPFSLYLRAYWADHAILDGQWKPPPVVRVQ